MNPGIPTTYNHVRFRSRLEAKWAAYFDLRKWKWQYEPADLIGWIPDFLLTLNNGVEFYSEIKPISKAPDATLINKIGNNLEFTGSALVMGVSPDHCWIIQQGKSSRIVDSFFAFCWDSNHVATSRERNSVERKMKKSDFEKLQLIADQLQESILDARACRRRMLTLLAILRKRHPSRYKLK